MSSRWFPAPPDIKGWHEEGYEIRERVNGETSVICRDCRDEETAHVIAAAPELYEVLLRFVDYWDGDSGRLSEPGNADPQDFIQQAYRALEKAEGRS